MADARLTHLIKDALGREPRIDWDSEKDEAVLSLRREFELGKPGAVLKYVETVLARSEYPASFPRQYSVNYETASESVVVDILLPNPGDLGAQVYEEAVFQCVLRTFYEVFRSCCIKHVWGCGINGFVSSGEEARCIVSIFAFRNKFDRTDFANTETDRALRALNLRVGGPLAELKPVQPNFRIVSPKKKFVYQKGWVDVE